MYHIICYNSNNKFLKFITYTYMILFLKSRGYHGILSRFSVSVRVHGDAHGFSHHAGDLFGVSMEELVSGSLHLLGLHHILYASYWGPPYFEDKPTNCYQEDEQNMEHIHNFRLLSPKLT